MNPSLSKLLLGWYSEHGRTLPWRETDDPYSIWVIETLLQQTRISQAGDILKRFLLRFPTVESLATAPLEAVLQIWQGLGYYQRAHNLHRAAQLLHAIGGFDAFWKLKGQTPEALMTLPGIGAYTARAILSFSRKGDFLPVDGNVVRILSRLWADPTPKNRRSIYQEKADALPLSWRKREVAYALMDLAQLICTPKRPKCLLCPLSTECRASREGQAESFPPPAPRRNRPIRHYAFYLYSTAEKVWLEKRPANGLWGGLWCVPMTSLESPPQTVPDLQHDLTHFRLLGYVVRSTEPPPYTSAIPWAELALYGLPAPIRRLLMHEAERHRASLSL
ncbi:MAG: NUDIX domain-containing protein [Bacteroidia bacterium]|nr:NUDIX domain-containing protein [Bacteroidia bacterium]